MTIQQQELDYIMTEPHWHGEESLWSGSSWGSQDIITLHYLQELLIFLANTTFYASTYTIKLAVFGIHEFWNTGFLARGHAYKLQDSALSTIYHHWQLLGQNSHLYVSPVVELKTQC